MLQAFIEVRIIESILVISKATVKLKISTSTQTITIEDNLDKMLTVSIIVSDKKL